MISIQIQKVQSIQNLFKTEIIKQRTDAISGLSAITTKSTEDQEYLDAVLKLFKNNPDILLWDPSKLDDMVKTGNFPPVPRITKTVKGKNVDGISPIKDQILIALGYKRLRISFYPKYFREIEIKACVYCNSQLTITAKKGSTTSVSAKFDVDHYRSKSKFPFLSICLFNLYPACAPCNRAKSYNENIGFQLYTKDDAKKSDYKFRILSHSKAEYLLTKDPSKLDFKFEEPPCEPDKKKFNEVFHIEGIYSTQKDVIEELIIKSQIYNSTYTNLLKKNFDNLGLNPELFKRTLVGSHVTDADLHKRPMNKFIMDIAKDLGVID